MCTFGAKEAFVQRNCTPLQSCSSAGRFGKVVWSACGLGEAGRPWPAAVMQWCCHPVALQRLERTPTNQQRRRSRQSNFSAAAPLQEAPVREPRKRSHLLLSIVDESSSYLVGPDWQTKFEVRWRHSGAASVAFFPLRLLLLVSSLPWPVACHGSTCQQPV